MKNKKLLFALALNAFSTSIVNANDQAVKKYNILYNNMVGFLIIHTLRRRGIYAENKSRYYGRNI